MLKRFGLGFGIGYILGARGGEKRYAQLASAGQRLADAPVLKDLVERTPEVARDTFDRMVEAVKERASFTSSGAGRSSEDDGPGAKRPPKDRAAEEDDDEEPVTDEQDDEEPVTDEQDDEEPVTDEQDDEEPVTDEQDDEEPDTDHRVGGSGPRGTGHRRVDQSGTDRAGRPGTRQRGGDRSGRDRAERPRAKAQRDGQSTESGDTSQEPERPRRRSLVSSVAGFASAAAERGRVA